MIGGIFLDVMNIQGEKNMNSAPPPSPHSIINQSNSIDFQQNEIMMEEAIKGTFNMLFSNNSDSKQS